MGQTAFEDQKRSISGHDGSERTPAPRRRYITSFGVVMLGVLAVAVFMYFNFRTVLVKGKSMYPTFKTNDKVLVCSAYWLVGPIKDGDVVVAKDPNPDGYIIKRVDKMGGETVDWKYAPETAPVGPFKVPAGYVYFLGDNRPESWDSRKFGPRLFTDILGKVLKKP